MLFRDNMHAITHQTRGHYLSGEEMLDTLHRSLEMLEPAKIYPRLCFVASRKTWFEAIAFFGAF